MFKAEKSYNNFENTNLTSNMEDYIEQIELLSREKKVVRVKNIAKNLNIKMPSVTAALLKLEEKGLIKYERYGYVELTKEGKRLAEQVYSRHSFLSEFFYTVLRINKARANGEACRIEHHLSPEACKQIYKLVEFYKFADKNNQPWTTKLKDVLDERLLSELEEGNSSIIVKINGEGPFKKRLQEMGFRKGEKIKILKYAPLKDPIKIAIKEYNISLRVKEAKSIVVKPITME